jgi:hypothetical protein
MSPMLTEYGRDRLIQELRGEFTAPGRVAEICAQMFEEMRAEIQQCYQAGMEKAARIADERAQDCKDDFAADGDERWLVYAKHAERLAAAIRATKEGIEPCR